MDERESSGFVCLTAPAPLVFEIRSVSVFCDAGGRGEGRAVVLLLFAAK